MAFLLAAGAPAEPNSAPAVTDWTAPRRHFAFMTILFDLESRVWAWGTGYRSERLSDCSTEAAYCLASETFSIALPKRCADLEAGRWSVASVRTEILYRHVDSGPPLHRVGSATTLYLGSPDRPNQMFVYDPAIGLMALYWDDVSRFDFIALARSGRLQAWLETWANGAERQRYYYPLTTLGRVGQCG